MKLNRAKSWVAVVALAWPLIAIADPTVDGEATNETLDSPDGPPVNQPDRLANELGGVLVDRTITMAGKTFYDTFSQKMLNYPIVSSVTLTVHERPSARWGSLIWISEGSRIHFRATVSPRLSGIEDTAQQSIDIVRERIINQKLMDALQRNGDLAGDEF